MEYMRGRGCVCEEKTEEEMEECMTERGVARERWWERSGIDKCRDRNDWRPFLSWPPLRDYTSGNRDR